MTPIADASSAHSVLDSGPSARERAAVGRAARGRVRRRAGRGWDPVGRPHDPLAILLAQNEARAPTLTPVRMSRMSISPWNYYRGAAAVMAADLATAEHTDIDVQLSGDAHVLNFGLWATPERQLSFDVRDFDETLRGPFEWDVKRFLASLIVLARDNGVSERRAARSVRAALRAYRAHIARYAVAGELDVWYDVITAEDLLELFEPEERERVSVRLTRRARKRTSEGAARKLTRRVDGHRRILADPPVRLRLDDAPMPGELATRVLQTYRDSLPYERRYLLDRFSVVDVVQQVVGVGSVGMYVFLVLLEDRLGNPLFLQVKQAGPSVYEPYLGASPYANHGQRVISGKRLIQAASDIFLGWTRAADLDFYVRQFRDMKVIPNGAAVAPYLAPFAERCGIVLARAHARTGDALAIDGYMGKGNAFEDGMMAFAAGYADQTGRDHQQLARAIASGAVESAPG